MIEFGKNRGGTLNARFEAPYAPREMGVERGVQCPLHNGDKGRGEGQIQDSEKRKTNGTCRPLYNIEQRPTDEDYTTHEHASISVIRTL